MLHFLATHKALLSCARITRFILTFAFAPKHFTLPFVRFQVEHILSEPVGSWTGKRGRIDATMLQAFLERPEDSKCLVCVCGPTGFTELAVQ